jgi:hypothetical protein
MARLLADGRQDHVRRRRSPIFFNSHRPLILNGPDEIESVLTRELVDQERLLITSGHPMGGALSAVIQAGRRGFAGSIL